jgi:hypothetical protein
VLRAYDLSDTNVVRRFMALYPPRGRVVSAAAGRVTTSRDTLEQGIRRFYDRVGRNMRDPRWEWGDFQVDVLAPDAAVLTAEYRVPHRTPEGAPHTLAGAWTAVFARRDGTVGGGAGAFERAVRGRGACGGAPAGCGASAVGRVTGDGSTATSGVERRGTRRARDRAVAVAAVLSRP